VILGDNSEASALRRGFCGGGGATVIYKMVATEDVAI
jgi:hypothetical protein